MKTKLPFELRQLLSLPLTLGQWLSLGLMVSLSVDYSVKILILVRLLDIYTGAKLRALHPCFIIICLVLIYLKSLARFSILESVVAGPPFSINFSPKVSKLSARVFRYHFVGFALGIFGLSPVLVLNGISLELPSSAFLAVLGSLPSLLILHFLTTVGDELLVPYLYGRDSGVWGGFVQMVTSIVSRPGKLARWLLVRSLLGLFGLSFSILWLALALKWCVNFNAVKFSTDIVATLCWLLLQVFVMGPYCYMATIVSLRYLRQVEANCSDSQSGDVGLSPE